MRPKGEIPASWTKNAPNSHRSIRSSFLENVENGHRKRSGESRMEPHPHQSCGDPNPVAIISTSLARLCRQPHFDY
ncbi:hypothetical protein BDV32DRAFT_151503 [Aspergillus pseudonomiae]|nr:hypothetical protein BDV32DRAFT_151503 [Aspergillus pseudonomiae]